MHTKLPERQLFAAAFLREPSGHGFRVVLLCGRTGAGDAVLAELHNRGAFETMPAVSVGPHRVQLRTPTLFLMHSWLRPPAH